MLNLEPIRSMPVGPAIKGFPGLASPMALGEIGRQGWNLLREDLPLPLLVLRQRALRHNGDWMRAFLAATGASFAPHGKTTMSPQLFSQQLADGAWAMTCATVSQLQVYRRFGVGRVIFANQLVGAANIAFVLDELARDPEFELYIFADSLENVRKLSAEAERRRIGRPLRLLLETGQTGARTGVRNLDAARALGAEIAANAPWLALHGVTTYEGILGGTDDEDAEARVAACFAFMDQVAGACAAAGYFAPDTEILLSAGGSQYFDLASAALAAIDIGRPTRAVLRSGCYLTHDAGHYRTALARMRARGPAAPLPEGELLPALELWACIQSRPEPGLALATAGKRDTSFDMGLPVPEKWFRPGLHTQPMPLDGHRISSLNDQHAHLRLPPDSPLAVGDLVCLGISHPCTTLDKWQVIPVIDDAYNIVDAIRTFF